MYLTPCGSLCPLTIKTEGYYRVPCLHFSNLFILVMTDYIFLFISTGCMYRMRLYQFLIKCWTSNGIINNNNAPETRNYKGGSFLSESGSNDTRQIKTLSLWVCKSFDRLIGENINLLGRNYWHFQILQNAGFAQNMQKTRRVLSRFLWQYSPAASTGTSLRGGGALNPPRSLRVLRVGW